MNRQHALFYQGPKYEYPPRQFERKPSIIIPPPVMMNYSNPDILLRKVRDKFCEPMWEAKLRENTKKFNKKLLSLRFLKFQEKRSFTIANNIDFCRWGLIENHFDLYEIISLRREMFNNLWENAFQFRQNLLVSGIYVDESLLNRKTYHEQIISNFPIDEVRNHFLNKLLGSLLWDGQVYIYSKFYPDVLLFFSYTTTLLKGYLELGSIGIMYYNEYKKPGDMGSSALVKERKLGDPSAFINNEEFLSEEDEEMKDLDDRYNEVQNKEKKLQFQARDSAEINKMRSETLESIIQEIMDIFQNNELMALREEHDKRRKKLEEKDREAKELAEILLTVREKIIEEQEQKKNEFFDVYVERNMRIDFAQEQLAKKKEDTRQVKKLKKKELVQIYHLSELGDLKVKNVQQKLKSDEARLENLKKELREKKSKIRGQMKMPRRYDVNDQKTCREFYCSCCGLSLVEIVAEECGHPACGMCYVASQKMKKCFMCQKDNSEAARIKYPKF